MPSPVYFIPGTPVAAARPRVTKRGTFTPKRYREWKSQARDDLASQANAGPLVGALAVGIDAIWNRPKRMAPSSVRESRPGVPDADNVGKAVLDAANGILFGDDAQVVDLRVRKFYGATGEAPGVWLRVIPAVEGRDCR